MPSRPGVTPYGRCVLEIGLTPERPPKRKKSRETRLSKVNREASNRGRNHSAKSRELDEEEITRKSLIER
jgi:hypothetical protein